jgi:hypothetical protein
VKVEHEQDGGLGRGGVEGRAEGGALEDDGAVAAALEHGGECHPACVANRAPEDAIIALIAATLLLLVPAVVVWAG